MFINQDHVNNIIKKPPLRTGHQSTTGADACSEDTRPEQAYCIIRSSQMQAEHLFSAGCYFYTQNQKGWYIWHEERNTRSFRTDSDQ